MLKQALKRNSGNDNVTSYHMLSLGNKDGHSGPSQYRFDHDMVTK